MKYLFCLLIASAAYCGTVSIPDTAGEQGEFIYIPIDIDIDSGIDSFGLDLEYDPDVLQYYSCTIADHDWVMFACNDITPGRVRVAGFARWGDYLETDTLADVTFEVIGNADSELNLTRLVDDIRNHTAIDGVFYICSRDGDMDQNGVLTCSDAQRIFQIAMGAESTAQEFCRADYDADGWVTMQDAQQVFCRATGGGN